MPRDVFATWVITTVLAAVVGCGAPAWGDDPAPAARLPVPAADAVTMSRELIRAAFEADYRQAKQSGEPAPLLDKLRSSADTAGEPVTKYAFLLEAEDTAAQHEDADATLALVERRAELFDIDGLAEQAKALARLASPKIIADMALLEQATATAQKAAEAERFDIAAESAKLALDVAKAIDREQKAARRRLPRKPASGEVVPAPNGIRLIKSAIDVQKRIGTQRDRFTASEEAKAVLATNPNNAAANAAVGTYLCFVAQKWDQGLPHLAKSGLATVSDLACEETSLKDNTSPDVGNRFALAGKWWDAAETIKTLDDSKDAIKRHAATIYGDVLEKLSDPLKKQIAENRVRLVLRPHTVQPPKKPVYLSDLQEIDPVVGFGTFAKNGDMGMWGWKIVVDGTYSPKGLSIHCKQGSEAGVTYEVPLNATTLVGKVGIADNDKQNGAESDVSFRIIDDRGTILWRSPHGIRMPSDVMAFKANVAGLTRIRLVTICEGSQQMALAVWIDPRFQFGE